MVVKRQWLLLALVTAAVATALAQQSPSEGQKEQAAKKTTSKSAHVRQPRNVKKLHALFEAIIEPTAPKNISFPMDPEDELTFHASKECLMAYVKQQAHEFDLKDATVKAALRERVLANHEKATDLLVEAVTKNGMTLQQARVGMLVAQVENLPAEERAACSPHREHAAKRIQKTMPHHNNALRAQQRHTVELEKLKSFTSDFEKDEWVRNSAVWGRASVIPRILQ